MILKYRVSPTPLPFRATILSLELPNLFQCFADRFSSLLGAFTDPPGNDIFHVINEVSVEVLVVAKAVFFACANGLIPIDVNIMPMAVS